MEDRFFSLPLSVIRAFLMAAEFNNLTRAAEALDLSQPSLSRILGTLEKELGAQLFTRSRRGVALTDAGAYFQAAATNLIEQVDGLVAEMRSRELSPGGRVVIGLPVVMTEFVTRPLANWFASKFPRAQLSVHEGISDELEFELSLGRLDIALLISTERTRARNLETVPLANEQVFLHAPRKAKLPGTPVFWKSLAGLPLILPRSSNLFRRKLEEASRRHRVSLQIIMEVNTPSTILSLVEAGAGYSVLPGCASYTQRARGTLSAAPIRGFKIVWSMVRRHTASQPTLVAAAETKLRELMRSHARLGLWTPIE
jgi:LysR family transcriptional regulator, nitrogen assimilation regulatory protein